MMKTNRAKTSFIDYKLFSDFLISYVALHIAEIRIYQI